MTRVACCVLLAVLGVAGCATSGTKLAASSEQALSAAPVVRSYADVKYVGGAMGETSTLALGFGALAYDDGVSRRFIAGVALPAFTRPYSIEIVSPRLGTAADPGILYPSAQLLNAQYEVVRSLSASEWKMAGSAEQAGLTATAFVNDDSDGARFLVVLPMRPDAGELIATNQNATVATPLIIPVPGGALIFWRVPSVGSSEISRMAAVQAGNVRVTFKPYVVRKVGDR